MASRTRKPGRDRAEAAEVNNFVLLHFFKIEEKFSYDILPVSVCLPNHQDRAYKKRVQVQHGGSQVEAIVLGIADDKEVLEKIAQKEEEARVQRQKTHQPQPSTSRPQTTSVFQAKKPGNVRASIPHGKSNPFLPYFSKIVNGKQTCLIHEHVFKEEMEDKGYMNVTECNMKVKVSSTNQYAMMSKHFWEHHPEIAKKIMYEHNQYLAYFTLAEEGKQTCSLCYQEVEYNERNQYGESKQHFYENHPELAKEIYEKIKQALWEKGEAIKALKNAGNNTDTQTQENAPANNLQVNQTQTSNDAEEVKQELALQCKQEEGDDPMDLSSHNAQAEEAAP